MVTDLKTLIDQEIKNIFKDIVALRRDIHAHPEIGQDLPKTAKLVESQLRKIGYKTKSQVGGSGVIGDLICQDSPDFIAFRADMDALLMQEEGDKSFASVYPGKAHMCGHDVHVAMAIGVSRILYKLKEHLKVNVRFIFQPAEEAPPGGALGMIDDGALNGVKEIYALHVWPQIALGSIGFRTGPISSQADIFSIKIEGTGGHASQPHLTVDPIVIASNIVMAAQSIISRSVPSIEPSVLSFTQFNAGSTHNVIPNNCKLVGTVRTFNPQVKQTIQNRMEQLLFHHTKSFGASYKFKYEDGYPPTVNHAKSTKKVAECAEKFLSKANILDAIDPILGGEDFAYYVKEVPGCFILLGSQSESKTTHYSCHDPRFDVDEDCMKIGMRLLSLLALC